jgi:uncharacterized repeat protein (TIGR03943 family)
MVSAESPAQNKSKGAGLLWWVHAAVLIAWIGALSWLGSGSGDDPLLGRFIRREYWWIVYTATGVFVALLASLALSRTRQVGLKRWRSLLEAIILSLPLFFLPLAVRSDLSVEAAEKRSLYTPRIAVKQSGANKSKAPRLEQTTPPTQRGVFETSRAIAKQPDSLGATYPTNRPKTSPDNSEQGKAAGKYHGPTLPDLVSTPEDYEGQEAELIGMVHKDKRLAADSFYCYRLLMVCCAADASPVGVIVKWPESSQLPNGAWVKAYGKVGFTPFKGEDYPTIIATRVEKIAPPKNRFLHPE